MLARTGAATRASQLAETRADSTACRIATLPTQSRSALTVLRLLIDARPPRAQRPRCHVGIAALAGGPSAGESFLVRAIAGPRGSALCRCRRSTGGRWVVNDRSDGSQSIDPEPRLLARGVSATRAGPHESAGSAGRSDNRGRADWYVEAADSNRASSRWARRRMSLWNDPRRTARRLRSPVGA